MKNPAPRTALEALEPEERRRWRLMVGPEAESTGQGDSGKPAGGGNPGKTTGGAGDGTLSPVLGKEADRRRDRCMELVYGRADGLGYPGGASTRFIPGAGAAHNDPAPYVPQWLDDLRRGFPRSVVEQVQREALARKGWERLLLEPENLKVLKHDANLVAALLALKDMVPDESKALARSVVAEVVRKLEEEIRYKLMRAFAGRASPSRLRRQGPATRIDWPRTIRGSMKHYQTDLQTIIPDPVLFRDCERRQFEDRHVILMIDQSGSMATSMVHAAVMGAVMATLKNISTRLILFDTKAVDVSDQLTDPVEVLFGAMLGGGTSIRTALALAQTMLVEPKRTLMVLVSDLDEGDDPLLMREQMARFRDEGVTVLCLLGLDLEARPVYNHANAQMIAGLGIPVFACTPDKFVDVMRCIMDGRPLSTVGVETPRAEDL